MLNAVVMVVNMNVVYTFNQSDHIKNMRVDVDDIVYCKHNLEEKTRLLTLGCIISIKPFFNKDVICRGG